MHRKQRRSRLVMTEAVRHSAQPHRSRHWVEVLVPPMSISKPVAQEWPLVVVAPSPRVSTRAISRVALAQRQTVDHRIPTPNHIPPVEAVEPAATGETVQDRERLGRRGAGASASPQASPAPASSTAVVGAAPRMAPGTCPTGIPPSPSLPGRGDRVVVAPGGE